MASLNGVRTVIVEDASRFARELIAQGLGITLLISRGVRLLTASGDDLTASDDPTRKMMRQIAGAFAETQRFSNLGIFAVGTPRPGIRRQGPLRATRTRAHLCVFLCFDEEPGIAAAFANASFTAAALAKTCRTAAAVINASLGIGTGSGLAPRRACSP